MASCSAWIDPVSEIAMVPVAECSWPTVTSVSVTASRVVFTVPVGRLAPRACVAMPASGSAGRAARPCMSRRRGRDGGDPFCSLSLSLSRMIDAPLGKRNVAERSCCGRGVPGHTSFNVVGQYAAHGTSLASAAHDP
ncbi:hypothetical protein D3C72_1312850 [compost metagenome]